MRLRSVSGLILLLRPSSPLPGSHPSAFAMLFPLYVSTQGTALEPPWSSPDPPSPARLPTPRHTPQGRCTGSLPSTSPHKAQPWSPHGAPLTLLLPPSSPLPGSHPRAFARALCPLRLHMRHSLGAPMELPWELRAMSSFVLLLSLRGSSDA